MRVAIISLEPWDEVWRRNQHLSAELVRQRLISSLVFVEPAVLGLSVPRSRAVLEGITAVTPSLPLPKRVGGLRLVGEWLRRAWLRDIDALWINDPVLGVRARPRSTPALYDVTDDWRLAVAQPRTRRRLIAAEDALARTARTVVCSPVLQKRWVERYGVQAALVPNGVSAPAAGGASPLPLQGAAPHVGYVGTLHDERLDVSLVLKTASTPGVGAVHLVGPNSLSPESRGRLQAVDNVYLYGAVQAEQVPGWMAALDVLICPHVLTPFTLSLDAIKSYEYLASGRPVVATPTSGFQDLHQPGVQIVPVAQFPQAVLAAASGGREFGHRGAVTWEDRARQFAQELTAVADRGGEP